MMKKKKSYIVLLVLMFLFSVSSFHAQTNSKSTKNNKKTTKKKSEEPKFPSYFGFSVRSIIPSSFTGKQSHTISSDYLGKPFTTTFAQKYGYSFGGTVRVGITKLIAFETGINYNQRHFSINSTYLDSGFVEQNTLSFINYEIPLNGLVYIQLSDKIYANVTMGGMLIFNPTEVKKIQYFTGKNNFIHTGELDHKLNFSVNASIGFEFRTEEKGIVYVGGSAVVPLMPLFNQYNYYRYSESLLTFNNHLVNGSYVSLDLKFFLPNVKNKGTQFTKGPIE
jgi:hypothetical protein